MPKWKKDAKEFVVAVNFVDNRGYSSSIPKPIMNKLGNPNSLKFVIKDDKTVELISGRAISHSGKVKSDG